MKIEQIKIYGFGKWVNQSFKMSKDVTVFYGENESGKSTLTSFISGMLFGFVTKKAKFINTYEPKEEAVYGGELDFLYNDKKYRLIRKNRTNSELKIIDLETYKEINDPEKFLKNVLGPINKDIFKQVYAINSDELNEIKTLTPNEMQQRLLKMGAVGSVQWLQVATDFEKEAQVMFAANSKNGKRPLNELISKYHDFVEKENKLQQQLPIYFENQNKLKEIKEKLDYFEKNIEEKQDELKKLELLKQLQPTYQEYIRLSNNVKDKELLINDETKQRFEELQFQKNSLIQELTDLGHQNENLNNNYTKTDLQTENNKIKAIQTLLEEGMELNNKYQITKQNIINIQEDLDDLFTQLDSKMNLDTVIMYNHLKSVRKNMLFGLVVLIIVILLLPINTFMKLLLAFVSFFVAIYVSAKQREKFATINYENNKLARKPIVEKYHNKQDNLVLEKENLNFLLKKIDLKQKEINNSQIDNLTISTELNSFNTQLNQLNQYVNKQRINQKNEQLGQADRVYQENYYQKRKNQFEQVKRELQTLLNSIGLEDEAEFHLQLVKQKVDNEQFEKIDNLKLQINSDQLAELKGLPKPINEIIDDNNYDLNKLKVTQKDLKQKYNDVQIQHLKIVNNGTLSEIEQKIANLQNEILNTLNNYFVKQLTAQWINEALKQSSNQRMPQIVNLATKYFKMLTGGNFVTISLNENGDSIILINSNHQEFELSELSKGTAEQLYIAFRLAFAKILADIIEFPIIIDDGFVNFDVNRLKIMHVIIQELGLKQQVIYLTSNTTINDDFKEQQIIRL